ncbi:MAG: aminodeoxychorismate/anthranilate synthase component II [Bacteroidota bacterium]
MNILVLDNYDSFTYNLVQYIQEILDRPVDVIRNDAITLDEVDRYDVIVLSPGPGVPEEAGIMPQLLQRYAGQKFILGVCLGHQAIGEAFGAQLENLAQVFHGIETEMVRTDAPPLLFDGIDQRFKAGRYHSWVIQKGTLPAEFIVTATDDDGQIMAIRHRKYELYGLQFHPESIMTPDGRRMLANFLEHAQKQLAVPA